MELSLSAIERINPAVIPEEFAFRKGMRKYTQQSLPSFVFIFLQ